MEEFLIYDLKVAVLIAVFYFCYRLLMERETMHRLNRIVLLSSILLSMVLPLCVITLHKTVEVEPMRLADHPEMVITDRLPCRDHTFQVTVGNRFIDMLQQNFLERSWKSETETSRIAGIQLQHTYALRLHSESFLIQRSANITVYILQSVRT